MNDEDFESLILAFESSKTQLWEVLCMNDEELVKRVKRSINEIRRFREHYRQCISSPKITSNAVSTQPFLSTGVTELDDLLGGGLSRRSVIEISGPAGSGKTCLSCQIALTHSVSSVYFSAEENFPTLGRRMADIINEMPNAPSPNCKFARVRTLPQLKIGLNRLKSSDEKPSVIIIDSIASILDASSNGLDIESLLEELALQKAAFELNAAIIITNQVRDSQRPPLTFPPYHYNIQEWLVDGDATPRAELRKRPVHGMQVAKHVTSRLMLSRPLPTSPIREVSLLFSKLSGPGTIRLEMRPGGLVSTDEQIVDDRPLSSPLDPLTPTSI